MATALSQIVRLVEAVAASAGAAPARRTTVARIFVPSCIPLAMAASLQLAIGKSIRVRAERIGSSTALSQIVRLVEAARASAGAAPARRTTDAVARIFVQSCILLAMAAPVLWLCLVFGGQVTTAAAHVHGETSVHCEEALFALKFALGLRVRDWTRHQVPHRRLAGRRWQVLLGRRGRSRPPGPRA